MDLIHHHLGLVDKVEIGWNVMKPKGRGKRPGQSVSASSGLQDGLTDPTFLITSRDAALDGAKKLQNGRGVS